MLLISLSLTLLTGRRLDSIGRLGLRSLWRLWKNNLALSFNLRFSFQSTLLDICFATFTINFGNDFSTLELPAIRIENTIDLARTRIE